MFDKLVDIEKRYNKLQADLANPEIISDVKMIGKISKDISDLEPIIVKYNQYKVNKSELDEAKELLKIETDEESINMFNQIIESANNNIDIIAIELKKLLIPKDPNDGKNAILEIRGAAGGDEANIFAYDLYRMYSKYAELNHWKLEILESQETVNGGFSTVSILVKGSDVFSKLKFESGTHRVQRVPVTESQGRVHTSTATVVVMPEINDVEIDIKDMDIRVDTFRSSGAGGQSVNTTDSAVRITHLETNIVVSCQTERSQISNREQAMKVLRAKIYDYFIQKQMSETDKERKNKLGQGQRSEKIRTYNYPQNRVTDHRIGLTLNKLDIIMNGKLNEVVDNLMVEDEMERLKVIDEDN